MAEYLFIHIYFGFGEIYYYWSVKIWLSLLVTNLRRSEFSPMWKNWLFLEAVIFVWWRWCCCCNPCLKATKTTTTYHLVCDREAEKGIEIERNDEKVKYSERGKKHTHFMNWQKEQRMRIRTRTTERMCENVRLWDCAVVHTPVIKEQYIYKGWMHLVVDGVSNTVKQTTSKQKEKSGRSRRRRGRRGGRENPNSSRKMKKIGKTSSSTAS